MDRKTLERAKELECCLDTIEELKAEFHKSYPAVNQIGSKGMTEDVLTYWKNMNIELLAELKIKVRKEFEEL